NAKRVAYLVAKTGSLAGTAYLWDIEHHRILASLPSAMDVEFSPEGSVMSARQFRGRATVLSTMDAAHLDVYERNADAVLDLGTQGSAAILDVDGTLVARRRDGQEFALMKLPDEDDEPVARISHDGKLVAVGNHNAIRVFSMSDGREVFAVTENTAIE